jgi:hypothetical protein
MAKSSLRANSSFLSRPRMLQDRSTWAMP